MAKKILKKIVSFSTRTLMKQCINIKLGEKMVSNEAGASKAPLYAVTTQHMQLHSLKNLEGILCTNNLELICTLEVTSFSGDSQSSTHSTGNCQYMCCQMTFLSLTNTSDAERPLPRMAHCLLSSVHSLCPVWSWRWLYPDSVMDLGSRG